MGLRLELEETPLRHGLNNREPTESLNSGARWISLWRRVVILGVSDVLRRVFEPPVLVPGIDTAQVSVVLDYKDGGLVDKGIEEQRQLVRRQVTSI